MGNEPELSPKEKEVVDLLPDTPRAIARELDISPSTVNVHFKHIRDKFGDGAIEQRGAKYYWAYDETEHKTRTSTKTKQTVTREANYFINEADKAITKKLNDKPPLKTPPEKDHGAESYVAVLGDLHFGSIVENEFGEEIYSTEDAVEYTKTFCEQSLKIKRLIEGITELDDIYLFLLGDICEGEGIYDGQPWETDEGLSTQISKATNTLKQAIDTYREHFDTVQISCVKGNHGRMRADGASKEANVDLIVYKNLKNRLIDQGYNDVSIRIGEAKTWLNTKVRNWNFHARHGQDGKTHVDATSSSQSEWRGWLNKHDFDVALRGHFHRPQLDFVQGKAPVVTCPSPKPSGEYMENKGSPSISDQTYLGYVFGTSDSRRMTWSYIVDTDTEYDG